MINLLRNKRKLYVCNVRLENDIKLYDEPIELFENYQVTNTSGSLQAFGLDAYEYIRIKTNISHEKYYHIGDRVYINVQPPKTHDKLCKDADYEVSQEPIPSLNEVEVMLKRRSGKRKNG